MNVPAPEVVEQAALTIQGLRTALRAVQDTLIPFPNPHTYEAAMHLDVALDQMHEAVLALANLEAK